MTVGHPANRGDADSHIVLTARHHACEAVASFVLEGALETLAGDDTFRESHRVHAVPFVDMDGIVRGDQGKNRAPHDHNRDYARLNGVLDNVDPIYPETGAVMELLEGLDVAAAIDIHCPYKWGGRDDRPYMVRPTKRETARIVRLSERLGRESAGAPLTHDPENDPAATDLSWAQPTTSNFSNYARKSGADVAVTLEVPYVGTEDNPVTPDSARVFGRALGRSISSILRR